MAYSDKAKEEFYEQLHHAIQSVPHTDNLLLLGDFNARVRSDHTTRYKVLSHHGIGKENSNGTLLLNPVRREAAGHHQCTIHAKDSFKTTWRHPHSGHWHQIDFVLIRQKDHALLKSKVSISFQLKRQHQGVQRTKKLDVAKLANSEAQDILRDNVASALEDLVDRH